MKKSQSKLDKRNPNQKKQNRFYHPFDKIIGVAKLGNPEAYKKIDEIYLKD